MQKVLSKILFSTRLMAVLFLAFAIAMAIGTFIEDEYNTDTARVMIYNTWWFEAMMLLFVVNFFGNIARYRLLRKEKWPVLLLHLSFIFIIIGAGITRYIGFEGMMPIYEGESVNYFLSEKTYLTALVDGDINGEARRKKLQDHFLFSSEVNNDFAWNNDFNGQPFTISYVDFLTGAEEGFVADENGDEYLKIVESGGGSRHEHFIKNGAQMSIHNIIFTLNNPAQGAINLRGSGNEFTIESPFEGGFMRMADQFQGQLVADSIQPLQMRSLYTTEAAQFVIPDPIVKGDYGIVPIPNEQVTKQTESALKVRVTVGDKSEEVTLLGGKGMLNDPTQISLNGLDFNLSFGAIRHELPFSIKLNDFIAEKYPGTEASYSSYMSKVEVLDDEPFAYDIYMNHVLDHKGYRFFQSSFLPNEAGTVLSVNHDMWGTWITYLGYFLLYIGLMAMMFFGDTRFISLGKMLDKVKDKRNALSVIAVLLLSQITFAQHEGHDHEATGEFRQPTPQEVKEMIYKTTVDAAHAEKFGHLVIQDDDGRMKPINTFASELLRKLSKSDSYEDLNADQAILSMLQDPIPWYHVPIIYIKKHNDSLHHVIGVPEKTKYVKAIDFFDEQGNYKLAPFLEDAYKTTAPNQFQKEFKEVDLKIALLNRALSGGIFKIFPIPNDENNKWVSSVEFRQNPSVVTDSLYANFINSSLQYYTSMLQQGKQVGNYTDAEKMLEAFKKNQQNYGAEVMPTDQKINAEIIYNKYDVFRLLFAFYMIVGSVMLILVIVQILTNVAVLAKIINVLKYVLIIFFIAHTVGLIGRWYISGHAPWSDAYESMIYVAWATMGMGILFARKSVLTFAATAFVTSMILMIAHWSWMDPAIGNLQPVLNSYWLMVHVAVIVASYGPFTLGMILGLVALLLYIIATPKNKKKIDLAIQEITIINELALTVGLVMLTIGNFLGGQWANESWGRYWGWDPKETWALISIMVYAFVIHMRLVPGLRGKFAFNFASIIAYASIMMTYFGVNFYLSGLHSYASGDKIITPDFVYITVAFVFAFASIAYYRYRGVYKKA